MNAAFQGKWTPIDPRWNLHELYLMFGGRFRPYIEHYTSTKPWTRQRPAAWRSAAAWYKRELADTAWADFIPPQSVADAARAQLAFLRSRYSPLIRDSLAKHFPFALDLVGKARKRADDETLPWAPKSRKDVEDMVEALIAEAERRCPRLLPPEAVLAPRAQAT